MCWVFVLGLFLDFLCEGGFEKKFASRLELIDYYIFEKVLEKIL